MRELLQLIRDIHDVESEYTNSLKKLWDRKLAITTHKGLNLGIQILKKDYMNQMNYHIEWANSIKEELIDPLVELYDKQTEQGRILNLEVTKIEKEFTETIYKLDSIKQTYHNKARESERLKLQNELYKLNTDLNLTKQQEQARLENLTQKALKDAKDLERMYVSHLNETNRIRDIYVDTMNKGFSKFQNLEEQYISHFKDTLRKYVVFEVALIRNLQYDIEKKAGVMEGINVLNEIIDFVDYYKTKNQPPQKIEFEPYKSEIVVQENKIKITKLIVPSLLGTDELMVKENELCNELGKKNKIILSSSSSGSTSLSARVVKEEDDIKQSKPKTKEDKVDEIHICVRDFINSVYYNIPDYNLDNSTYKALKEITSIVDLAWEGKDISYDLRQIFNQNMKKKSNRKAFLECLNKLRQEGYFCLSKKAFDSIGVLMYSILTDCFNEENYDLISQIITLAFTFYKISDESNMPRVFLQTLIEKHKSWGNIEMWKEMIKYSVCEDLLYQKSFSNHLNESKEERILKTKKSAFSNINSTLYNIISYSVSKSLIKTLILDFSDYYNFTEDQTNELLDILKNKIIKEVKIEKTTKVEQEQIEFKKDKNINDKEEKEQKDLSVDNKEANTKNQNDSNQESVN